MDYVECVYDELLHIVYIRRLDPSYKTLYLITLITQRKRPLLQSIN